MCACTLPLLLSSSPFFHHTRSKRSLGTVLFNKDSSCLLLRYWSKEVWVERFALNRAASAALDALRATLLAEEAAHAAAEATKAVIAAEAAMEVRVCCIVSVVLWVLI